jgi:Rieske Fe-S protein
VKRRSFLSTLSSVGMGVGLVAGYGTFAAFATRYLYPSRRGDLAWLFVAEVDRLRAGDAFEYVTPLGAKVAIARTGDAPDAAAFVALSSTCPHLGCQVHWEAPNDRFFCPCHNGAFDRSGKAIAGPPMDAGQSLPRYALKVERGLLYIEVPVPSIAGLLLAAEEDEA